MCGCKGGSRHITITFEMGPSAVLPMTAENLKQVTSIGVNRKLNTLALLIQHLPPEGGPDKYEVIDLKPEKLGDLNEVGRGGIKVARMMLEALTGQPFVEVELPDDQDMRFYARQDFKDKVDAL